MIIALLKKELKHFFASPFVYIILGLFSLLTGIIFFNYISTENNLTAHQFLNQIVRNLFGNIHFFFVFLAPLLSMHLIASEKNDNTLFLLQFSKLKDWHIIYIKFLAVLITALFISLAILIYPTILMIAGYYDLNLVLSNYLGTILSCSFYLSIGLFFSTLTSNVIVAGLCSMLTIFSLIFITLSGINIQNAMLSQMLLFLSPTMHFEGFNSGIITSYSIFYYLSGIFFFNYLSAKTIRYPYL